MKMRRLLAITALAGGLLFSTGSQAHAQDIVSNLLYGLLLGSPYGQQYGGSYGQYGTPYGTPYGSYGGYDSYGLGGLLGGGGYNYPQGGYYDPYAYDYDRGRDPRYDYQGRQERLAYKYDKAMRRLDREEQNAREEAYRTHRR
jgi:hypothetical protein